MERRQDELCLIMRKLGEVEYGQNLEWVIIRHWLLPPGWNKTATSVLVLIPPGYPVTPPDNFYADNDLRLSGGSQPGSTSLDSMQLGRPWLQFSYHVEAADWRPHSDVLQGHNLPTFLDGVARRLGEAS